jgi:hypothetical protein
MRLRHARGHGLRLLPGWDAPMSLSYSPALRAEILARRKKPSQQFGQTGDSTTFNGASGCTHTVLQWLIWREKGKWQTHDQISKAARTYPRASSNPTRRGFRPAEVENVCDTYKLPYKVVRGWSALEVARASKLGPVGFGHMYGWWPEWKGFRYAGVKADGRPNGYATPTGKAGRTQLRGFDGRHFGLLLGYATDPDGPDLYYAWEPNHNSPARPEKPPYDRMSYDQFRDTYYSYQLVGRQELYALVPKGAKR